MRLNRFLFGSLSAAAFTLSFAAYGSSSALGSSGFTNFYYIPHVYLSGYGGSNLLGNLDVLAPVYLKNDRNLYVYGSANYAGAEESGQDSSWSALFGAGYRQMFNWTGKPRIYGGYLLGSYNYSSYGNNFWVINPGIESLGQRWDYRVNAYLPVGDHKFDYQDFASNHGDDSYINAHDNETDDMLVDYYEDIGYGADAEFGGRLFSIYHMPVKGYVDGYYYNMQEENGNKDLFGAGARVTFQPTAYLTFEVKDTYDDERHNLFEVGAKIYINGFYNHVLDTHVDDQDLQLRLFEDIQHNFGTIDGVVSSSTYQDSSNISIQPMTEHQLFYSADVSSGGDGTAENPYPASDLNQASVDAGYNTWDDAQFVLASGDASSYTPGNVEMYDGTSMVGKNSDYTALAEGSERPVVYGSLTLDGYNTINSIFLYNLDGESDVGINIANGAQSVFIDNSVIGVDNKAAGFNSNQQFETGVSAGIATSVNVNNSTIYAEKTGIHLIDSTAKITGSTIQVSYDPQNMTGVTEEATGILMEEGGSLTVDSSTINASIVADATDDDNTVVAYGIHASSDNSAATSKNKSKIYVLNGTNINVTSTTSGFNTGNAYGVLIGSNANYVSDSESVEYWQLVVDNSTVNASASSVASSVWNTGNAWGILVGYGSVSENDDSDFSVHDNTVSVSDNSTVNAAGSAVGYAPASGNGVAIAIGYGYVNLFTTDNQVSDVNMSISGNSLDVTGSTVTASGSITGSSGNTSNYSGRGIGVLVGYSALDADTISGSTVFSEDDFTINNNTVNLQSSSITSHSANDGKANTAYDNNSTTNEQRLDLPNTGYGVLIGYGSVSTNLGDYSSFGADNNTVNVGNATGGNEIDTTLTGSGMDNAVGLEVGNYYASGQVDTGNTVNYQNNTFNTSTTSGVANYTQYSIGIYLPQGSATTETISGNKYYRRGDGSNMIRYGWGVLGSDRSMADMTTWIFVN